MVRETPAEPASEPGSEASVGVGGGRLGGARPPQQEDGGTISFPTAHAAARTRVQRGVTEVTHRVRIVGPFSISSIWGAARRGARRHRFDEETTQCKV